MFLYRPISGLLLILLPVIEISVYIMAARQIGLGGVIGLSLLSTFVGGFLLRHEGLNSLREFDSSLKKGELPVGPVIRGWCGIFGAFLMILPGLLTSAIGLMLVLPGLRDLAAAAVETWLIHRGPQSSTSASMTIIEGSYDVLDPDPTPPSLADKKDCP